MKQEEHDFAVGIDYENPVSVDRKKHAHHTSWAYDPFEDDIFLLALHGDESNDSDKVMAVAAYSYEQWEAVFHGLQLARAELERRKRG